MLDARHRYHALAVTRYRRDAAGRGLRLALADEIPAPPGSDVRMASPAAAALAAMMASATFLWSATLASRTPL